jgi:hypothetical protein
MDKYIAVKTGEPSFYQIYILDNQIDCDTYNYLRDGSRGIIIFKNREACENKINELIKEEKYGQY